MLNIEFVILLGWGILILGFVRKDVTITSLAAMFLMIIGTTILIEGYGELLYLGFGAVHIATGFYVFFRSGTETYKGKSFKKPRWLGFKKRKEEKE